MEKITSLTIHEICKILNVKTINSMKKISFISLNSKEKSKEDFCFIAIKGKKYDGHNYIEEAISNGAILIISENEYITDKAYIINVKNSIKALGAIAKYVKQKSKSTKTICVTGSVGKTTVSKMVSLVLEEKYLVNKTQKNYNNEIGVPLSLFGSNENTVNVIELGMRGRGEIEYLASLCEPECSIITNVGSSHIGILGDAEAIFEAKLEILKHTSDCVLVPSCEKFKNINYNSVTPIFIGDLGDCYVYDYQYTNTGIEFSICYKEKILKGFKINSFSLHNLTNAMFAIVIGILNLVDLDSIRKGLIKYSGESMREEIQNIKGIVVINDCYNASFESMKSAIFALAKYAEIDKKIPCAFIGDMLELGRYSEELHYRVGELAKDCGVDKLFVTGKYATNIMDGYSGGIYIKNPEHEASKVVSLLNESNVLLVKGSRKIGLEKFVDRMRKI